MTKLFTALALLSLTQMAHADMNLRRCETPEKFAYWTPTPCAKEDIENAGARISTADQAKPYSELVSINECKWQALQKDARDNPRPPPEAGAPRKATVNWGHCK